VSYIQSLEVGGSWHWFGGSSNTRINIPVTVFVFVYGVKKAATPAILSVLKQEERGYAHDTCVFLAYFWLCWVFVASCRLSLIAENGVYLLAEVSRLLTVVASLVAEHRL